MDGAHLGVTARRALATILGGEPQPSDEECMTDEQFAAWIESTPFDLSGHEGDDLYTESSRWLAKRYLLILEQAPAVDEKTAWEVFKAKWPDDAEEAGGMTGFMHGWAWNAALHSLNRPPEPNPAILLIGLCKASIMTHITRIIRQLWSKRYAWLKIRFETFDQGDQDRTQPRLP